MPSHWAKRVFYDNDKRRYEMYRKKMKKNKDKQVFKQTANKTKAINVSPVVKRGGIRLWALPG